MTPGSLPVFVKNLRMVLFSGADHSGLDERSHWTIGTIIFTEASCGEAACAGCACATSASARCVRATGSFAPVASAAVDCTTARRAPSADASTGGSAGRGPARSN